MWKQYSIERLPMFDSDDDSIRGGIDDIGDIGDDVADLFDDVSVGDILDPDTDDSDNPPAADDDNDDDKKDKNDVDDSDKDDAPDDDVVIKPKGDEPTDADDGLPPAKSDDPTEVSALKDQITALTQIVTALKKSAEPEPDSAPKKTEIPPVDLVEQFKDTDFDTVMETKEGFLKFLSEAMAVVQSSTVDSVLESIPGMVDNVVTQNKTAEDVRNDFYGKYPELSNVKKYVSHVANEISAADPNLTMAEVLDKAAAQSKADLNLTAVIKKDDDPPADDKGDKDDSSKKKDKPTLPGSGSKPRSKDSKPSKLQADIDDIIND